MGKASVRKIGGNSVEAGVLAVWKEKVPMYTVDLREKLNSLGIVPIAGDILYIMYTGTCLLRMVVSRNKNDSMDGTKALQYLTVYGDNWIRGSDSGTFSYPAFYSNSSTNYDASWIYTRNRLEEGFS